MRYDRNPAVLPVELSAAHRPRLYSSDLIYALLASTGFGVALATFYLLPRYLVTVQGASVEQVGAVTGAFGLATVVGAPLTGLLIDRISRRWLIAVAGLVMGATCLAFAALSEMGPAVYFLRGLQGICFAVVFTAVGALTADLAPPARLSEALGLTGASMLAMSALVPPVVEVLALEHGWSAAFVLAAAAAAGSSLLAIAVREPRRIPPARSATRAEVPVWRRRATRHYALVTAALGGAFGVLTTYTQPFALELGRTSVGGFFASYGALALVARLGLGRQVDRLGRFRVAVFALNLYATVVLTSALGITRLLELTGAVLGVAHGLFFPAFNALAASAVKVEERGRLFAVFTGAFYGGLGIAVLAGGFVAGFAGYRVTFVASGLVTLAAGAVLVLSPELTRHADD